MLKKILATGLVACAATAAFAQTTNLVPITNVITTGADFAGFQRGITHFTYDIQGTTPANTDWTGSELTLDVVGAGTIWHASDQKIATASTVNDPNAVCYLHDLAVPGANNVNGNTAFADTFFTGPGTRFTVAASFASPGLPAPDDDTCAPPPIVSTSTRLRGLNPSGQEIPLAWFDTVSAGLNNTTLARITFQVPALNGGLQVVAAGAPAPAGTQLFAVLRGRTTTNLNSDGTEFGFDIYQIPEPSTMALLALGGLAGLIRRR